MFIFYYWLIRLRGTTFVLDEYADIHCGSWVLVGLLVFFIISKVFPEHENEEPQTISVS